MADHRVLCEELSVKQQELQVLHADNRLLVKIVSENPRVPLFSPQSGRSPTAHQV